MNIFSTAMQTLNQHWVLLVLAVVFLWKISTWKANIENRLSNTEKSLDVLSKNLDALSKKVDDLYSIIISKFGRSVEQADSPVTVTDYGKDLSGRINAEAVVDVYADNLYEETKGMNAYQVQEHCFIFCKEKLLNDLEKKDKAKFDNLSAVAFDEGIEIEKLMRIVGILLRDRVLSMKGKSHAEVD